MGYLYLVLSGILFGGVVFFGKVLYNMGASTMEVMLYSNLLSGLVVAVWAWKYRRELARVPLKAKMMLTFSVFLVDAAQYIPLFLDVSVTLVVLLMYLQPIWTILIERFYYKVKIAAREWLMVFLMIFGLVVLIDPFHHLDYSRLGVSIAVAGGIGLSLWLFVTRYFSAGGVRPAVTYMAVCFYGMIPLAFLYIALLPVVQNPQFMALRFDFGAELWAAFVFYAAVILALPNLLLYANSKAVAPEVEGMILLLEPVTGITLDVLFLNTALTWNIILGGAIILGANMFIILNNSRRKSPRKIESGGATG